MPGRPSAGLGFGDQAEPGFAASHQPDVVSTPNPRCTYYLGACLEQGKATRLKQDSPVRDLAPQPPVLPSIASKHLETLVTGACETLVGSYWLSNQGVTSSANPGHILGHTGFWRRLIFDPFHWLNLLTPKTCATRFCMPVALRPIAQLSRRRKKACRS